MTYEEILECIVDALYNRVHGGATFAPIDEAREAELEAQAKNELDRLIAHRQADELELWANRPQIGEDGRTTVNLGERIHELRSA